MIKFNHAKSLLFSVLLFVSAMGFAQTKLLSVDGWQVQPSRAYNGNNNAIIQSVGTTSGRDPLDDVYVVMSATYDSAVVGSRIITVSFRLTGRDASKYTAPASETINGSITCAQLYIDGEPGVPPTKSYDGTDTVLKGVEPPLLGVVPGDNISLTTIARYYSKSAGYQVIYISYALSGEKARNYCAPTSTVIDGYINPIPLYASNTVVKSSKVYDRTLNCEVVNPGQLLGRVVASDSVTLSATAKYTSFNVGEGIPVSVKYSLTGADSRNYIVPTKDDSTYTANITEKQLSAVAEVTMSKEYDKTRNAASSLLSMSGNFEDDNVTAIPHATYDSASVGNNRIINVHFTLSGTDAYNYLAPVDSTIFNAAITRRHTSVTAHSTTVSSYKEYDGTDTAQVTYPGVLLGISPGDDVKLKAVAHYNDSSANENKQIFVTYYLEGPNAENYDAPLSDTIYRGSITPKQLSVQTPATIRESKVYDGTTFAEVLSHGTPGGVIPGDDVSFNASAEYLSAKVDIDKRVHITYVLNGLAASNYKAPSIGYDTADITPRQLDIRKSTFDTYKYYDGNTDANVTKVGDLLNVVAGDSVTAGADASYDTKAVGIGTKTIYLDYSIFGSHSSNYYAPERDTFYGYSILPLKAEVTTPSVTGTKTYDGTDTAAVANPVAMLNANDSDDVEVVAQAKYDDQYVGEGKRIIITYVVVGGDSLNYSVPEPDTLYIGKIEKRYISIAKHAEVYGTKEYDANKNCQVRYPALISGIVPGDIVDVESEAFYNDSVVGAAKPVKIHYSLSGRDSTNYALIHTEHDTVADITRRQLYAQGTYVETSKKYDGTKYVRIIDNGTYYGEVTGDSLMTLHAFAEYDSPSANSSKTIYITYTVTGPASLNYFAPVSATVSGTITSTSRTIKGTAVATSKEYDGTTSVTVLAAGVLDSIYSGDDVTVVVDTAYFSDHKAGIQKSVTVVFALTGADKDNYMVPAPATLLADITPRQLNVSGTKVDSVKIYDRTRNINVTSAGTLSRVIPGDNVTLSASALYQTASAGNNKPVDVTYTISGSDSANYIAPANATLTADILPATITVSGTAVQTVKPYDGNTDVTVTNPGTVSALAGDDVQVQATATYDNPNVGTGKDITVTYTLTGDDADNYVVSGNQVFTNGEITPLATSVTGAQLAAQSKIYDGTTSMNLASNGSIQGKLATDSVYVRASANFVDKNVGNGKMVIITYSLSGAQMGNYQTPLPDTLYADIICKPVTVSGTTINNSKVYDGTNTATINSVGTVNGLIPGDNVSLTAVAFFADASAGSNKQVTVSYTLNGTDSANYCINDTVLSATYTISKAQLTGGTVTYTQSRVYDATTNATVSVGAPGGIVGSDSVLVSATAMYGDKNVGTGKLIYIFYTISGKDTANYIAPADTIVLGDITPAPLGVDSIAVDEWKMFDGNTVAKITRNPILNGVFAGDVVSVQANADYDTPAVGQGKTITASYTTSGIDATNYMSLANEIVSINGRIFDSVAVRSIDDDPTYSFKTDADDYCQGDVAFINYLVTKGDPYQYRMLFSNTAKSAGFEDIDWAVIPNSMTVTIPDSCVEGTYMALVQVRNELQMRDGIDTMKYDTLYIKVRISNRYIVAIFDDVVSIDNREERFFSYQWYKNDQVIANATLPYYQEEGGLDGEYYVVVNIGTLTEQRICSKTFNLKGSQLPAPTVTSYPNPVEDMVSIVLEGFTADVHSLTLVNPNGIPVKRATFEGDQFSFDMGTLPSGIYSIIVDGVTVKTIKK